MLHESEIDADKETQDIAGLLTTTVSSTVSLICAVESTQVVSTYLVTTTTSPSNVIPTESPSCLAKGSHIKTASVTALISDFCSNSQRAYGSMTVTANVPSAQWEDIVNDNGPPKTLDVVWVTIITTRSSCASTTLNLGNDAGESLCAASLAAVMNGCSPYASVLEGGCFDE